MCGERPFPAHAGLNRIAPCCRATPRALPVGEWPIARIQAGINQDIPETDLARDIIQLRNGRMTLQHETLQRLGAALAC